MTLCQYVSIPSSSFPPSTSTKTSLLYLVLSYSHPFIYPCPQLILSCLVLLPLPLSHTLSLPFSLFYKALFYMFLRNFSFMTLCVYVSIPSSSLPSFTSTTTLLLHLVPSYSHPFIYSCLRLISSVQCVLSLSPSPHLFLSIFPYFVIICSMFFSTFLSFHTFVHLLLHTVFLLFLWVLLAFNAFYCTSFRNHFH